MLKLTNISKTFNPGTEDAKLALDNVSLHVRPGDFISIIGANGAGKSTLFGAIAGSFITDSGEITLDGADITLTPEYKRSKQIGRLFQDPMRGSAPGMTIEENLALAAGKGGWLHRLTKQEKKQLRERVALLGMGLEDRMSQPVGLLSGGQRQALTLMMATYNPPKLLLLDEHTAALDPEQRKNTPHVRSSASHLPHDHPQHNSALIYDGWNDHDERRKNRSGRRGRGARRAHRLRSSRPLPRNLRQSAR